MNPIQIVSIIVAGVLSFTPMSAIKDNKDAITTTIEQQIVQQQIEEQKLAVQASEAELQAILDKCDVVGDVSNLYFVNTETTYTEAEKKQLAQVLLCESGGSSWEAQVLTMSAILNHCDRGGGLHVLDEINHFAVAPYYRSKTPTSMQYEIVDYVLSGHRVANLNYFRSGHYHDFGTRMLSIDNTYFSM